MINKDAKFTAFFGIGVTVLASIICFIINAWAGAICLILGIVLTGIYFYNIKKRNDKINELNNYLSLMCSGNFDLDIMDNSEGEMSILKNNLYKIMTLLKTQNEQLNTDKLYLANSLADISHQLKTPLTSMMVMSDLLKDEKDEGKRNEFLSIIETQLDKMKWLITNLLKISKLDAGATEFKHEKFNIAPILEKSLKQFYVTCDVREIEIVNEINDFEFVGDENWTGEAIENIIKNVDKCIDILEDKLNKNKYINKDYTDYTSLINIINDITDNFNELSLLAYDNTLSDKLLKITNYISISEKIEKEKLMKKICSLRHHLCKYYIGNKATLLFEKNGFGKNEFALNDTLSDFLNVYIKKNNNIDIDVRTLVNKKKRLTMSIVAVLGLFYIVYAMIVVPLIMMLF